MKKVLNRIGMNGWTILLSCLWLFSCILLSGCSDDDEKDNREQYITQLTEERNVVDYLLGNSIYGTEPGTYPEKSKTILETVMAEIDDLVSRLNHGETIDRQTVDVLVEKAEEAMKKFKDSVILDVSEEQRNLQQLKNKLSELQNILETSTYGTEPGTYPESSKSILNAAIQELADLIDQVSLGNVTLTKTMVEEAIQKADTEIDSFRETQIETETFYNLVVDGNNGGYIDFGYHKEFADFGETQHAALTIELWVRIDEYCTKEHEDNSTYLAACNDEPWGGWRIYSRFHTGGNDDLIRATIPLDKDGKIGIEEPYYRAPLLGYQTWMHYAIVYAEDGVPGEDQDERFRMFYNGEKKGHSIRIGQDVRRWVYTTDSYHQAQIPMTAFCRLKADGTRMEYFSGSIKYMRIWKKARTADEIKVSAEGNCTVDPADPNLVCAWDFVISKADLDMTKTEFKDLTGRYTAVFKGGAENFTWKPVNK
ncbi:DUF4972 domain-containing protein [Bacteroides congonensis]|jgi:hypothetical protein|uniref:DUF4972 domain-containing protein n=1 Tax=Bacteroides congonensis TaxID=1871006 RepID=UPI0009FB0BD4|nr:DUF4972 domain-containing protein [Bacteroides congonensis]